MSSKEGNLRILGFDKICRICLKSGIYLQSIFKYKKDRRLPPEDLSIKMKSCHTTIERGDGFPSQICANCANLLKVAYYYSSLATKSFIKLKKIHKNMTKKQEEESARHSDECDDFETIDLESVASDDRNSSHSSSSMKLSHLKRELKAEDPFKIKSEINSNRLLDFDNAPPNLDDYKQIKPIDTRKPFDLEHSQLDYKPNGLINQTNSLQASSTSNLFSNYGVSVIENSQTKPLANFSHLQSSSNHGTSKVENKPEAEPKNEIRTYLVCPCTTRFVDMETFREHMLLGRCPQDSETHEFKCYGCAKVFPCSDTWLDHEEKHCQYFRPGSVYKCSKCNDQSACRYDYEVHMRRHSRQPLPQPHYQCGLCERVCKLKSSLAQHFETHQQGNKNYICETCGDKFRLPMALKIHQRRHTGERPFQCKSCGYSAIQSSALRIHMIRRHGAPNKYKCTQCEKVCVTPKSLREHIAAIHEGLRNFVCNECGVRYKWKRCLDKHIVNCGYVKTRQRK